MSAKIGKKFAMSNVDIIGPTRRMATLLVERQERVTGSKMTAYDDIASAIGASSSWLRDFIGRSPRVNPDLQVGWNIITQYRKWCARIEKEIENERALIAALRGPIDAVDLSALDLVARAPRTKVASAEDGWE